MKRMGLLVLAALMCVFITGCGKRSGLISADVSGLGQDVTIDRAEQTITAGEDVYRYSASDTQVSITYPNGYVYSETSYGDGTASASWRTPVNAPGILGAQDIGYLDEDKLVALIRGPSYGFGGGVLPGLLLMGIGILNLAAPKFGWTLSYGWRYKNAEPSDAALILRRVTGALTLVIGIVVLFL